MPFRTNRSLKFVKMVWFNTTVNFREKSSPWSTNNLCARNWFTLFLLTLLLKKLPKLNRNWVSTVNYNVESSPHQDNVQSECHIVCNHETYSSYIYILFLQSDQMTDYNKMGESSITIPNLGEATYVEAS